MTIKTIEEFSKTYYSKVDRPVVTALYPEIQKWRKSGYTLKLIHAYLVNLGKLKCSYATFCRYITEINLSKSDHQSD